METLDRQGFPIRGEIGGEENLSRHEEYAKKFCTFGYKTKTPTYHQDEEAMENNAGRGYMQQHTNAARLLSPSTTFIHHQNANTSLIATPISIYDDSGLESI